MASTSTSTPLQPCTVLYCAVCSFPPEYCEFSSKSSKCKEWLEDAHPDLFKKYYSEDALEDKMSALTVEQREQLDKDLAKKERKEEAKAEKEKAKLAAAKVIITRIERNKRKYVTSVKGLELFDIDLKKASKYFATRFAAAASVTKTPQGDDEILIQGDVAYDIEEIFEDPEEDKKAFAVFGSKIGEDQYETVEQKLKKKSAQPPEVPSQF
ncbi:hypothetical protein MNV49_004412 [Pseudohyphozyma bogoriensis]|nr:hypothetical protein MNV49_004412 [Pseudohyphozyma bogoriensis]